MARTTCNPPVLHEQLQKLFSAVRFVLCSALLILGTALVRAAVGFLLLGQNSRKVGACRIVVQPVDQFLRIKPTKGNRRTGDWAK